MPRSVALAIPIFTALLLRLSSPAAPPVTQHFNPRKQLVLDSRVIADIQNLRLTLGRIEKEPRNPLLQPDRPYENALNNLYPNVTFDATDSQFKLWYKDMLPDRDVVDKMMPPRIVLKSGWFGLYATSRDGLHWEKPDLGLFGFEGSTRNNIYLRDNPNTGVFKDAYDPDGERRYKMVYDVGRGKLRSRFSADGIHWSSEMTPSIVGGVGDTHNNAFYDPRAGKYVLITRLFEGERKVARSESLDFTNWTPAKVVLESLPAEKGQRQTYCMPSFAYGNVYLGFLMLINSGADKSVDCELAWSPDTVKWERVCSGSPLIPRGPKGTYDAGCIYGPSGGPILRDGRLMILYGGSEVVHVGTKRHCLPCWAYLRPDGFAAYEPTEPGRKGSLLSMPLRCTGEPLRISADGRAGAIRVAVVDTPGFELDQCHPIRQDVTDQEINWNGRASFAALKGKTVRLKFELDSAKLYAFSGVELLKEN